MFKNIKFIPQVDVNTKISVAIIVCFGISGLLWLSILNLAGSFGNAVGAFITTILGRGAFLLPLSFIIAAAVLIKIQKDSQVIESINTRLAWGLAFMITAFNGFLALFTNTVDIKNIHNAGGMLGYLIYPMTVGRFLGPIGTFVVLIFLFLTGFFLVSQMTFVQFISNVGRTLRDPMRFFDFIPDIFEVWKMPPVGEKEETNEEGQMEQVRPITAGSNVHNYQEEKVEVAKPTVAVGPSGEHIIEVVAQKPTGPTARKPRFSVVASDDKAGVMEMRAQTMEGSEDWKFPPFDLLKENTTKVEPGDIEANKQIIKETLTHFGIQVEPADAFVGPTVTQYTLKPANGVRLSAIESLQRNLALSLAASNIRIEAPIPGHSLVGVEIPNRVKSQVRLRDMMQTSQFVNFEDPLPVAVGKDVSGHNLIYSLAKMPHLLVAGATGSGKSVWINGMLVSLLYRYSPRDLQLILVDMKKVELKLYEGVPHLLAKVITDAEKAINALKWTILEMERRYKLLEEYGKRNIRDFNSTATKGNHEQLSYIVFVIDELGDLMMLAKAEVEPIVVRLTQMSRAVGIHLVLGTQRPDTQVVTGLIKANTPTRIAFAVASQIDSRVILDVGGAEKLLGQGDGLITSPSNMHPVRFQGPNVDEAEVRKCVDFLKRQAEDNHYSYNLNDEIVSPPKVRVNVPGMVSKDDDEIEGDEVFEEAKRLVVQYQKASTSFLQQMMGIGYPRAAKIIMRLEEMGVIGPGNGSKPREVYTVPEE